MLRQLRQCPETESGRSELCSWGAWAQRAALAAAERGESLSQAAEPGGITHAAYLLCAGEKPVKGTSPAQHPGRFL